MVGEALSGVELQGAQVAFEAQQKAEKQNYDNAVSERRATLGIETPVPAQGTPEAQQMVETYLKGKEMRMESRKETAELEKMVAEAETRRARIDALTGTLQIERDTKIGNIRNIIENIPNNFEQAA